MKPNSHPKRGKTIACERCGKPKYYPLSALKRGARFCSKSCSQLGRSRTFSAEHKDNISASHHDVSGPQNPNWKGGIVAEFIRWRNSNWKRFATWRKAVMDRCGNKCADCGELKGLDAHHIFSIKETREIAFEPWNGVALCRKCHSKTDSYGGRSRSINHAGLGVGFVRGKTIPHRWQEYPTAGNWHYTATGIYILVTETGNDDSNLLIFTHEFVEAVQCRKHGITAAQVTAFDLSCGDYEPGDNPAAPYHREHMMAMSVEKMLCQTLGVRWEQHELNIERATTA